MNKFNPVEILIVEDNQNDLELMLRSLKKGNLANNLYVVSDGEEALDFLFCRNQYIDRNPNQLLKVVFLDLKLPKLSGLEVLKEIKNNETLHRIPVVIITSSQEDPDINMAYELGANGYVVKPVDYNDFQQAINNTGFYWLIVNETAK